MENNNAVQLVLPLGLEQEPKYKDIVKQNWQFTFSRQVMTSVYAKRVVGLVVSQMKESGEFKPYYQLRALDIIRETGLNRVEVYDRMKKVVFELAHVVYFFENEKDETIIPRSLLDLSRFENPVGYHQGVLTIAFNPTLKDIIMELAHYSDYELSAYLRFSSWYSMRLWEMLSAFRDTGWMEKPIDEYRDLMGCGYVLNPKTNEPIIDKRTKKPRVKYPNPADLIKYTTAEPFKELFSTELAFTVTPIYDKLKSGKGRRPIIAVRFDLIHKQRTAEEKCKMWCITSEDFRKTYERLKKYMITDENIAKYAMLIGKDELEKLLKQWYNRQLPGSKNPILNVEKFCNKVIYDIGIKILEAKKEKNNK